GNRFVAEFLVAERRYGNLAARFADGNQTHDVLQCPSATPRIEPVYILDATKLIVTANSCQVDRSHQEPGRGRCPYCPAGQSSAFLRDSVRAKLSSETIFRLLFLG